MGPMFLTIVNEFLTFEYRSKWSMNGFVFIYLDQFKGLSLHEYIFAWYKYETIWMLCFQS